MKKRFIVLFCVLAFFALLVLPNRAKADVAVSMVADKKPTPQFKNFVTEFVLALSQCFQEAGPVIGRKAAGVEMRPFFLVEQRGNKKPWQVGLCELKGEARPTSKLTFSATFHPIWRVEGKKLKNKEKIRELAREAANFLFSYLQKEGV